MDAKTPLRGAILQAILQPIVIAAIAREMAAFLWAIGRTVEPQPAA